jgi:hypothetical protein
VRWSQAGHLITRDTWTASGQVRPQLLCFSVAMCGYHSGWEVIFTTIESLTQNGRDRSLDYKISHIHGMSSLACVL